MLGRADDLAKLTVQDAAGAPVELGTLWRDKPAVLAFVRHFGGLHCREHVAQLRDSIDDIHAAGAEVHVIGNGAPMFIEGFRDTTKYQGPVYTDPSLAVYKAAELKRGMFATFNPAAGVRTIGALARGFRQGKTMGDATQQGGVLVVDRDGSVVYHHISNGPGDNAKPAEILRALRERHA